MRLTLSQLKKLAVETKSGFALGKVKDIVLETDGQTILQYEVGNYFGKKYLISREQVVGIDEEKIIVDDGIVGANCYSPKFGISKQKVKIEPEGVMTSETGN